MIKQGMDSLQKRKRARGRGRFQIKNCLCFLLSFIFLSRLTVSTNGLKCCAAALKCCQFCLLTWQCPLPPLFCYTPFSCSFSLSALPGNLQHGHQYFCCSNGQQKKHKVERSRKTSLPHPEMLLLPPFLTPWPPLAYSLLRLCL